MEMLKAKSSILYTNTPQTIFLLDIPTSLILGQELLSLPQTNSDPTNPSRRETKEWKRKTILSCPPLTTPYPSPPEPKTPAARKNVLSGMSESERTFHEDVVRIVGWGVEEIRRGFFNRHGNADGREWCLERYTRRAIPGSEVDFPSVTTLSSSKGSKDAEEERGEPPVILPPTSATAFRSFRDISGRVVVKNPSSESSTLQIRAEYDSNGERWGYREFSVPPFSAFILGKLPTSNSGPISTSTVQESPIPGLTAETKFNLILLDPPWPNRSVQRSRHYSTNEYFDVEGLTEVIRRVLQMHLYAESGGSKSDEEKAGIAAIWVTNAEKCRHAAYTALRAAGLDVCEEWIWVKTTTAGEMASPLGGLWRKPYEVLVVGRRREVLLSSGDVVRRVIAAVPDVHSRKPNLKEVFERVFFAASVAADGKPTYSALEVFARNLTAGWWSCGDEVLKFNSDEWLFSPEFMS